MEKETGKRMSKVDGSVVRPGTDGNVRQSTGSVRRPAEPASPLERTRNASPATERKKMSKTRKPGFLEDDKGNPSSMRLMSVIALIASTTFGMLTILHPIASKEANGLYITVAFLLAAFAPKALQKFAEVRFPAEDE